MSELSRFIYILCHVTLHVKSNAERVNWKNVLNKQRFEATLRQRQDNALTDNLGQELTHALQRAIEQQIATDNTLTPHSTIHFTMQSSAFTHAFQSATFTYVNWKKEVKDWARISRPSRPN